MNEEFYIKEIKISIKSIIPNEIENTLGEFNNYLKSIIVTYCVQYVDTNIEEDNGIVNLTCKQVINTETYRLNTFINFNELKKEDFYPLIIESATSCEELQKIISHVRYKNGLEVKPIQNQNIRIRDIRKFLPFK